MKEKCTVLGECDVGGGWNETEGQGGLLWEPDIRLRSETQSRGAVQTKRLLWGRHQDINGLRAPETCVAGV